MIRDEIFLTTSPDLHAPSPLPNPTHPLSAWTRQGGHSGHEGAFEAQLDGPTLNRLLREGHYERIAEILEKGDGAAINNLVQVAKQICWLGRQCQAEIERYRQAAEKAGQLEAALRQQLQGMLVQLAGTEPPLTPIPSASPCPLFKIHCFGPFEVYRDGQLLTAWTSLKARAIFKYLVTHQDTPLPKDILMDLFWPDSEPEAARRNLHQAIYSLRHALKQGGADYQPILFENDCYLLNPELNFWVDVLEFEQHYHAGQRWEQAGCLAEAALEYRAAEALYRGDFLEEDLYEEWTQLLREQWRNSYLSLANWLSDFYLQQGEYPLAIQLCQKIVRRDSCAEEAYRRLMACYQAQGQRQLAIRQYQTCLKTLESELGLPPAPETQQLYAEIIG